MHAFRLRPFIEKSSPMKGELFVFKLVYSSFLPSSSVLAALLLPR